MNRQELEKFLAPHRKLREHAKALSEQERAAREEGRPVWGAYGLNIEAYFGERIGGGLDTAFPELRNAIKKRVDETHTSGNNAVFLDVCGETTDEQQEFGFDSNVTFSLTSTPGIQRKISLTGNIFSNRDRRRLVQTLGEVDGDLVCTIMGPVHGLVHGEEREYLKASPDSPEYRYTAGGLQDLFEKVYNRSAQRGFIVVDVWNVCMLEQIEKHFLDTLRKRKISFTDIRGGWMVIEKN